MSGVEARAARGCGPCGAVEGVPRVPSSCCSRSAILLRGQCKYSLRFLSVRSNFILQRHKNTSETQRWLILGYSTYRKLVSSNSSSLLSSFKKRQRITIRQFFLLKHSIPLHQALKLLSRLPSLPVPAPGSSHPRPCSRPSHCSISSRSSCLEFLVFFLLSFLGWSTP